MTAFNANQSAIGRSERHDHRELAREMKLFTTTPEIGSGLPLWMPDGAVIRAELEEFAAEIAERSGCRRVYTPVLAKRSLYERSGHWAKFSDDMFPVMNVGGEEFVLRPANCPHHAAIYAAEEHSYRDLPIRLSELGAMFRSELSGVLSGLSRVRQINLDDAHVFCRPDQVAAEVVTALKSVIHVYNVLGIDISYFRLSLRDTGAGSNAAGYLGSDQQWQSAELALEQSLTAVELDFRKVAGEAAFYGPKIDVQVLDASGHEETLSTIQIDFNQPERFGLYYIDSGGRRQRPVMIHRGLLSSMERMTALLLERFDGRLPTWLAPTQAVLLPLTGNQLGAAESLRRELGTTRTIVDSDGPLGGRIRAAHAKRAGYVVVLGPTELENGTVNVTAGDDKRNLPRDEFIRIIKNDIRDRQRRPDLA